MTTAERLGAGRYVAVDERPAATVTSVHELTTTDGAALARRLLDLASRAARSET